MKLYRHKTPRQQTSTKLNIKIVSGTVCIMESTWINTQMLHGAGIMTYMTGWFCSTNVGKYSTHGACGIWLNKIQMNQTVWSANLFLFFGIPTLSKKNITFGLNSPQNYAFNGGNPKPCSFQTHSGRNIRCPLVSYSSNLNIHLFFLIERHRWPIKNIRYVHSSSS